MPRRTLAEPEAFHQLLDRILRSASERGMQEGELARRAGISPATLSRLKSRGDAPAGVLVRLGRIVGLRLTLVPDDDTLEAIERGEFF